jgi:hypothetical protein
VFLGVPGCICDRFIAVKNRVEFILLVEEEVDELGSEYGKD